METINTDTQTIEFSIRQILEYIGDDPKREGLLDTPKRIVKSWKKLFGGYKDNPQELLKTSFTEGSCNEMVILKDIEFYSTCEHHFLPFTGKISIGYLPNGNVVGVSKLARLVEIYARRLQIQERFVGQIADDIMRYINAQGCMVVCEAQHMCMTSRGVEKQQSVMVTSAIRGVFFHHQKIKDEFLSLIK
jgi:GTP cyclohydrolase I